MYCSPWHMLFKKSHNMHMFFSLVCSTPGPMSSLDTVSKFTVSQWDITSSMVGYHDHVSTASSQRYCESQSRKPEAEFAWQPGKQVWVSVLISQQPTERDKTCVRKLFTQKHIILIHVRHHVSIYVCLFFCTVSPTAVGIQQRGCLLKEDMSAGEDANCCSGRQSIGILQGHTPWVLFWVPSRASTRLTT